MKHRGELLSQRTIMIIIALAFLLVVAAVVLGPIRSAAHQQLLDTVT